MFHPVQLDGAVVQTSHRPQESLPAEPPREEKWLNNNHQHGMVLPSRAAHSYPLNGALKAHAFWWMMTRMAG